MNDTDRSMARVLAALLRHNQLAIATQEEFAKWLDRIAGEGEPTRNEALLAVIPTPTLAEIQARDRAVEWKPRSWEEGTDP